MEKTPPPPTTGLGTLAAAPGNVAHRLFVIFENRLQLLLLEVEEERERILRAIWFSLAGAVFGLLAGMAITILIVLAFWRHSPVVALVVLVVVYLGAMLVCFANLGKLLRSWETLPATLEELRKDRECLEKRQD
jgi:uncharacterized membrane protein YqjE